MGFIKFWASDFPGEEPLDSSIDKSFRSQPCSEVHGDRGRSHAASVAASARQCPHPVTLPSIARHSYSWSCRNFPMRPHRHEVPLHFLVVKSSCRMSKQVIPGSDVCWDPPELVISWALTFTAVLTSRELLEGRETLNGSWS